MEPRISFSAGRTALGESHSPFMQMLIDHLPSEIFWKDREGRYLGANQQFLKKLGGVALLDVLGKTDSEIHPTPEMAELYRMHDAEITADGRRECKNFLAVRTAEGERWWDITKLAMVDGNGQFTGIIGIYEEATQRLQRERDLHRQRGLLDNIIEHLPVGLFVKNAKNDYRYQIWNKKMEEIFGTASKEMLGKSDLDLFGPVEGEYRLSTDLQVAEGDYVTEIYENVERAHERLNIHVIKFPLYDIQHQPEIVVGFVEDVTDWLTMREQLKRHRDHLQQLVDERTSDLQEAVAAANEANKAKTQFLANMSHELRTPMHAIINYTQMGVEKLEGTKAEKLQKYFTNIEKSSRRLLALVNDLLDLSKMEAGKMQFRFTQEDVKAAAEQAIEELRPLWTEKSIRVVLEDHASATGAVCDATRLLQLFINLLSNAIKFSDAGKAITVIFRDASITEGVLTLPALSICVKDEGIGIPEGELEEVFYTFSQSTRTKTGAGGTGLGLTICRQIAEAHGGTLNAHNNPEGGSSFILILPLTATSH